MKNNLTFPKYLSIQTTSICNASCIFCPYQETKDLFPKKTMKMDLYRKIIDECINYKDVERIILYMNNEPLTDPYLTKRIDYAKEKVPWANIHILTNGLSLTDKASERLLNSKLDWIGISFHGIRKDTVEKAMGIPYRVAFDRINNFIEKAKERKNIKEYIMVTFLKHNYLTEAEKEKAMSYWKDKGIERISYFNSPISRAGNVEDLPKVYHKEKVLGCNSIWADEMIHIVEDGNVVLCCMDWKREVVLGDLNKGSISEVWNKKRQDIWQAIYGEKEMPDNFICRRCEEAAVKNNYNMRSDKTDILFVNLPPWGIDTPPLGTACLSSYLRNKGIRSSVFDLNIKLYNAVPKEYKYLWSMNYSDQWYHKKDFQEIYQNLKPYLIPLVEEIIDSSPRILGFSLPTRCSDLILKKIVEKVKDADPSKKIVLGGISISIKEQRQVLIKDIMDCVDYCVIGEGEEALHELVLAILKKDDKKINDMEGVLVKEEFLLDAKPVFVKSLDILPMPTFEEFDRNEYKVPNSIVIEFSRGCVGNCPFCDFKSISPIFRSKSPQCIFNQIRLYKEVYNVDHLSICDSAVNGNIKVLDEFCDLLVRNSVSIRMNALAIPRKEMTPVLLKKMKKAGFYRLEYGIESGSNKVLKNMRKIFTAEVAERVLRDTFETGIKTYIYLMIGFPGEKESEFNETKEFLKRNARFITMIRSINPLYIMAGSEMFNNPKKFGIDFPGDKDDSNWFIQDENNIEIRKKRVGELKEFAERFKIPFSEDAERLEFTKGFLLRKNLDFGLKPKVLLTICPMWDVSLPPLGISYLASYLEDKKMSTDLLDMNVEIYTNSDSQKRKLWKMENYNLWSWEDQFEKIKKYFEEDINRYVQEILKGEYKIVGFSLYGANVLFTIELAKRLKKEKPDLFIVFGGSSCSFLHTYPEMPVRFLVSFKTHKSLVPPGIVDAFVVGEGEETLFSLVNLYFKDKIAPISGAILYLDGKYTPFSPRPLIKNLDDIPYPAWDKLPLKSYLSKEALPVLMSRGCLNRCTFCNDWNLWGGKYRFRSALNIFEEIKTMVEKFGIHAFNCNDLLFNGNLKLLGELAQYLMDSNLSIKWGVQGVIRRDMGLPLLKKLKVAGLDWITYGVESLSENVLEKMNKKYSFKDIKEVLKNTKEAGIGVSINLIVGFPNETEEDLGITKMRLESIKEYVDSVSSLSPCYIVNCSDLQEFPENFSISPPGEGYFYLWETLDSKNTYDIRNKRAKELHEFIEKIGIRVNFVNVYDYADSICEITEGGKKSVERIGKKAIFSLINLPPWAQENPPIGIGYLCSYLRKKGISFNVFDLNKSFYLNHPDFKMLWHVENKNFWSNKSTFPLILEIFKSDMEKAINEILSYNCDILGFSVVDPKERLTVEFIKRIKERSPNKKIILGGPATSTYEQRKIFLDNINNFVDVFVLGEGEETLFYLLDKFLYKGEISDVEGCYIKNNGKWTYKEKTPIYPLDKIPFPTYEEFDLDLYGKSLLVEWSRGCIGKCGFCKNYRLFPIYRSKPVNWVINELRHHKEKNNITEFTVVDNILNGNLKNLAEICNRIKKDNLKIRWTGQVAPYKSMDFEFFKKMRDAGCFKLQIGLESGSNNVLKLMKKTFTSEISERNIRSAKRAGIETEIFIMVGFPGESEGNFYKTYDFVKRNAKYIDTIKSINTLHLIAGTEVYERAHDKFNIKPLPKENWHYLWETYDGNTYEVRRRRAQRLLDLAYDTGTKVMETNIREGKEDFFEAVKDKKILEEGLSALKDSVNLLQELPQEREIVRKKRSVLKWLISISLSFYTFFYIVYFWIHMLIRNKVLLGGRRR